MTTLGSKLALLFPIAFLLVSSACWQKEGGAESRRQLADYLEQIDAFEQTTMTALGNIMAKYPVVYDERLADSASATTIKEQFSGYWKESLPLLEKANSDLAQLTPPAAAHEFHTKMQNYFADTSAAFSKGLEALETNNNSELMRVLSEMSTLEGQQNEIARLHSSLWDKTK